MTSTTVNHNSNSSSQQMQMPLSGSKSGPTSALSSLANATEPTGFSFNQQQASVATFPQRTTGGTPTANTQSPFGELFSQPPSSGSTPPFSFSNSSSTDVPAANLSTVPSGNVPRFSFGNAQSGNPPAFSFRSPTPDAQIRQSGNPPAFSFHQPTPNAQIRQSGNPPAFSFHQPTPDAQILQSVPSLTITPSIQKQEISNNRSQSSSFVPFTPVASQNQTSTTNEPTKSTQNNTRAVSQRLSDPPTPTSQQPSPPGQEPEEPDDVVSLTEQTILSKKVNTQLRDPKNVIIDRSDPTSPLYSLKAFQDLNLHVDLLKGVYNMGFETPSKIQEFALPYLINNPPRNVIAQSQSGTGKTAAFSLAILSRIDPSIQSPQALIIAPTFELALQIASVIEKMAQFLPYIKIAYAVRELPGSRRTNYVRGQLLREPIVIGTPGTVEDWCMRRSVIDLKRLRICCIDEADVIIATENFQQICVDLVEGLNQSECQMMLFSATYSDEVMDFARKIVPNPVVLRLKREKQVLNNIRQYFINCADPQQKYHAIEQIYAQLTIGQAIIFCRTKRTARELAIQMAVQQHSVRELTGALDIEQRASVINQFREGLFRVLISTNVTARGIDIDDVSLVINYDMPTTTTMGPDYETYLHRIGRCGRFGKLGYTFNLISSAKDFEIMKAIEVYFSHPINEITIDGLSQLESVQD